MKKICIAFNHLQVSDGVARSAIAIANYLSEHKHMQVILRPIFICNKETYEILSENIKVKPFLGFYIRGLSKVLDLLPKRILHWLIFGEKQYDVEIGFQHGISTKAAVSHGIDDAKHLVWVHGYDEELSLKKYYLKADRIICVSKYNCEKLRKALNVFELVDYCYNPIDEKIVQKLGKEKVEIRKDNKFTFVTVGRHSEEKGYGRFIEIIAKLCAEGYEFRVWLIGNGPQHSELVNKVKQYSIDDTVFFAGEQKNPHKYTAKADVFVCSSFAEGYSTVCTEACILEIPVLTTDVGGAREIIDEAQAGMVVGVETEELYKGMKYILEHQEIAKIWKNTLCNTKKNFYSKKRVKKLIEILKF